MPCAEEMCRRQYWAGSAKRLPGHGAETLERICRSRGNCMIGSSGLEFANGRLKSATGGSKMPAVQSGSLRQVA